MTRLSVAQQRRNVPTRSAGLRVAAVFVAALAGGGYFVRDDLRSAWLARELNSASSEQAPAVISRIAGLGEPGIPILAAGLNHSNDAVAILIAERLSDELELSGLSDTAPDRRRRVTLDVLAAAAPNWRPEARHAAGTLAEILIDQTAGVANDPDSLDACALLLRIADEERRRGTGDGLASVFVEARREAGLVDVGLASRASTIPSAAPPEDVAVVTDSAVASDDPPGDFDPEDEADGFAASIDELRSSEPAAAFAIAGPEPNSPAALDEQPQPQRIDSSQGLETASIEPPPEIEPPLPIESMTTRQLFTMLHDSSPNVARSAHDELFSRGFGGLELDLAKQAGHPQAAVRRKLAERLPGLAGIHPKPWLLYLSDDPEPSVRIAALSVMATTGEQEMTARIDELVRTDPNPEVRQRAARFAAQREELRRE